MAIGLPQVDVRSLEFALREGPQIIDTGDRKITVFLRDDHKTNPVEGALLSQPFAVDVAVRKNEDGKSTLVSQQTMLVARDQPTTLVYSQADQYLVRSIAGDADSTRDAERKTSLFVTVTPKSDDNGTLGRLEYQVAQPDREQPWVTRKISDTATITTPRFNKKQGAQDLQNGEQTLDVGDFTVHVRAKPMAG